MRKVLFTVVFLMTMLHSVVAQRITRTQYIDRYSKIAVREMNRV